jgi:hypothetical protein
LPEQAAKQAREHSDREKEAGAAGDPAVSVGGEPAAGHQAMEVGMMQAARTIP